MNFGLDLYTLNARLKPALLTVLPAAILIASWPPGLSIVWSALWALLVGCGATFFLAQFARDQGKRLERKLFDAQGGRPSELLLSHAHAPNSVVLAERHRKLRAMLPHLRIPTREEELEFPGAGREVYAACVIHLIAQTRGDALLLKENINYGFRRNLLGLKPIGLTISVVVAIISALQWLVVPLAASLTALAGWLLVVRPDWPSIPSSAYADRLMEWLDKQAPPRVAS